MIVKVLKGHTTPETAFVQESYPYSFNLRCRRRVWLERHPKKGYRLCTQTTNPKVAHEMWNAPKKSTYTMLAVMGLDEEDHVEWTGCSVYEFDKLEEFGRKFGAGLDEAQRSDLEAMVAAFKRHEARKKAGEVPAQPKLVDVTDEVTAALRRNNS